MNVGDFTCNRKADFIVVNICNNLSVPENKETNLLWYVIIAVYALF